LRYSREYLDRLAAETGFQPDALEKALRLGRFLSQVTRHPFLGDRVVLKGGTALNLFFARAPRLSADLDFNYVGAVGRGQMLEERGHLERALEQIASSEEYRVQRAAEEHAGRKFYLSYRGGFGTQDRIEVDVNFMFRVPLCPPAFRDGWSPDPDIPCRARLAGLEEVMAGKLLVLLDRMAARDLYDVAWLASTPPPHDATLLRRLFVSLSGILPRPLTAYSVRHLDAFTQEILDRELAPFLRTSERLSRQVLADRAATLLAPLLNLSPAEREYVERLQWGEFRPELLVGDTPELLERLRVHPGLLWKVENAQKRPR
jgi:hypothetical protein